MTLAWEPRVAAPSGGHLERADAWGSAIATRLQAEATLWAWGDLAHDEIACDLVDGLVERGAIGKVRHLRLDAPLSADRTRAVADHDLVMVYAGEDVPRSALLGLRRTGATILAVTPPNVDWATYADDILETGQDEVRRTTNRMILAYARTVRRQQADAPSAPPFAAAYHRQVSA